MNCHTNTRSVKPTGIKKSLALLRQAFFGSCDPMVYLADEAREELFLIIFPEIAALAIYKNLFECEYPSFHPSLAGIVYTSASAKINFLSDLVPVFSTLPAYI